MINCQSVVKDIIIIRARRNSPESESDSLYDFMTHVAKFCLFGCLFVFVCLFVF